MATILLIVEEIDGINPRTVIMDMKLKRTILYSSGRA